MKSLLVTILLALDSFSFAQSGPPPGQGLSRIEVTAMLATGSSTDRIAKRILDRGLDFDPDAAFLQSLQDDGEDGSLITALKSAPLKRNEVSPPDPALLAKDSEALAHLHRAARANRNNFHPSGAEPELRLAAAADPANPFVHLALGEILARLEKDDEAIVEFRSTLSLQPDLADAHVGLGDLLTKRPAMRGEALEHLQRAVALSPSDSSAHYSLANVLDFNGDKQGAAEQRKLAEELRGSFVPYRIRVGGKVMQAKIESMSPPHYPQEAKQADIEGTVRMNVMVGMDGSIKDIDVITGDPILTQAALKAVWKWRYKPTTLNGRAVEVVTEVDVNFTLH